MKINFVNLKKKKMRLFDYSWFDNYDEKIEFLSNLAMSEKWDYTNSENFKPHPILRNYIDHTFKKVYTDGLIENSSDGEYCIFNTGLVTENQEEIFAFFQKNKKQGSTIDWYFIGWKKESDREILKFARLPENVNYFDKASDLIFNHKLDLRINADHIIEDNFDRFPEIIRKMDKHMIKNLLNGTIDDAKKRLKRNYKTAIPQYYNGNIQLLLPICLMSKSKADLALVIENCNGSYRASTCLTLDMAINNARLIAKPDDEWLKP